jgi:hypothetical protein
VRPKGCEGFASEADVWRALYNRNLLALVVVLCDTAINVGALGLVAGPEAIEQSLAGVKKAYAAALRLSARAVMTKEDCGLLDAKSASIEALVSKLQVALKDHPSHRRRRSAANAPCSVSERGLFPPQSAKAWQRQLSYLSRVMAETEKVTA